MAEGHAGVVACTEAEHTRRLCIATMGGLALIGRCAPGSCPHDAGWPLGAPKAKLGKLSATCPSCYSSSLLM